MDRALLIAAALAAGCYDPKFPSGGFACSSLNNFVCPDGLRCDQSAGLCVTVSAPDAMPGEVGCSDGSREALRNRSMYPGIAACQGAWDRPGVVNATDGAHCNREAGNDGLIPDGSSCNVADLCANGWHVCTDLADVANHMGGAGCGELSTTANAIYVTRQRGAALTGQCVLGTQAANNVYGCGSVGAVPAGGEGCAPLNRELRINFGQCPLPWNCGSDDANEGQNLIKAPGPGGALCCKDP